MYNWVCVIYLGGNVTLIVALQVIQIILSVTLIGLILMQGKGGGMGSIFGGDGGVYHTRRGVEKLMYQVTIGLSIIFFLVSISIVVLG